MKKQILSLIIISQTLTLNSAFACPVLKGNYICTNSLNAAVVNQEVINNADGVYQIGDQDEIKADAAGITTEKTGDGMRFTTTATCTKSETGIEQLVVKIETTVAASKQFLSRLTTTYQIDESDELVATSIMMNADKSQWAPISAHCKRTDAQ